LDDPIEPKGGFQKGLGRKKTRRVVEAPRANLTVNESQKRKKKGPNLNAKTRDWGCENPKRSRTPSKWMGTCSIFFD